MAKAPPTELAYALHTQTCTYLLDDEGICRWIVSPRGVVPSHVRQAIGAQFVACLDLDTPGGLIGELRVGAMALFVAHKADRMVLLRSGLIHHVDDRRGDDADTSKKKKQPSPAPAAVRDLPQQYGKAALSYVAKPPPRLSVVRDVGREQTITVTVPRREPPPDASSSDSPPDGRE